MLYWFKLYVSIRHGGYATKNKELYREWNTIFGFERNAERFLDYPSCCVWIHNLGFGSAHLGAHLYSIIKDVRFGRKSRQAIQQFLINLRFLHHHPCKSNCVESISLNRKFESVIKKYHWLVGDSLHEFDKQKINGLIQILEFLPTQLPRDKLKDVTLITQLEINPNDIKEILENGRAFRENIQFGIRILQSFL